MISYIYIYSHKYNVVKYSHDTKSARNHDDAINTVDRSLYRIARIRKTNKVYLGSLNFCTKKKKNDNYNEC